MVLLPNGPPYRCHAKRPYGEVRTILDGGPPHGSARAVRCYLKVQDGSSPVMGMVRHAGLTLCGHSPIHSITMTKRFSPLGGLLPIAAILLSISLMTGCSGCGGSTTGDTMDSGAGSEATTSGADAGAHHDGDGHGHDHGDGTGHDHGDGVDGAASRGVGSAVPATPEQERASAVEDLNGMRATLVAELESVRARLKDGTRTAEDKKNDATRAAELAQGLERLDRTIKKISDATDVSWSELRESSLKEAGEFRAWMEKYGMAVAS